MPIITIPFNFALNVSVQPTDILYASITQNQASGTNHPHNSINTAPAAVGVVIGVNHETRTITVDTTGYPSITLGNGHYLFFSKDRRVNISGIIGYFAETEYRNYSKLQAEIFATAIDFVESSK